MNERDILVNYIRGKTLSSIGVRFPCMILINDLRSPFVKKGKKTLKNYRRMGITFGFEFVALHITWGAVHRLTRFVPLRICNQYLTNLITVSSYSTRYNSGASFATFICSFFVILIWIRSRSTRVWNCVLCLFRSRFCNWCV